MTKKNTSLQIIRFFDSTPDVVYSAWTEVNQLKKWHAPTNAKVSRVEIDLQIGGKYKIVMMSDDEGDSSTVTGEYIEIETNKRIVYTWGWEGSERVETQVTVEFYKKNGGTELLLTHECFVSTETRDKHNYGWSSCLDMLEVLFTQ